MTKQKPIPPSPARRSRIRECVNGPMFVIIVVGLVVIALLIFSGCTMHVHLGGRYYTQPDRTETATERVDRYLEKAETENAKVAGEQPDD